MQNSTYFLALALQQRRAAVSRAAARALIDAAVFEANTLAGEREERQAALPSLEELTRAHEAARAEYLRISRSTDDFQAEVRAFLASN